MIISHFADAFEEFNSCAAGKGVSLQSYGRVYMRHGKPYLGPAHFKAIGESWANHQDVRAAFSSQPPLQGGLYAGAAGEANLGFIAASKADAAIVFDINAAQRLFWQDFLKTLAASPTAPDLARNMQDFAPDFYYRLRDCFSSAAKVKNRPLPGVQSPDPKDHPISPREQRARDAVMAKHFPGLLDKKRQEYKTIYPEDGGKFYSPLRAMTYDDFKSWFAIRAGQDNTVSLCNDIDLDWMRNPALYTHLHEMAKARAIATATLDVMDTDGCATIGRILDNTLPGQRIRTLYMSNIGYFLQTGEGASYDFTKRKIGKSDWAQACENLRPLMEPQGSVLRFDKARGQGAKDGYAPSFKANNPETMHLPHPLEIGGLIPDSA